MSSVKKSCVVCGQSTSHFCSGCHNIVYCSSSCQKKDWSNHKISCFYEIERLFSDIQKAALDGYRPLTVNLHYKGKKVIQEKEKKRIYMIFDDGNRNLESNESVLQYFTVEQKMAKDDFWCWWATGKCETINIAVGMFLQNLLQKKIHLSYQKRRIVKVDGAVVAPRKDYVLYISCFETDFSKPEFHWDCDRQHNSPLHILIQLTLETTSDSKEEVVWLDFTSMQYSLKPENYVYLGVKGQDFTWISHLNLQSRFNTYKALPKTDDYYKVMKSVWKAMKKIKY